MSDRTVLTVVDQFCACLLSQLQIAAVSPETIATVSRVLTNLRSQLEPFDEQLRFHGETVVELGHRIHAAEHRLNEAMATAAASQHAVDAARRAGWECISHVGQDLRSPLIAILNLLDNLSYEDLTAGQRIIVTDIVRTGEEVFDLVDDTLILSRLEAGILTLSSEPVAPADALDDACHVVKPLADDHGVAVTIAAGDPGVRVRADRFRLVHSLAAVIGFAVTSSRPGGEVSTGWADDHECVRMWICDTGHGFTAETLTGLFDPARWMSNTVSGGSRLRLVLARRLVEAMHGSIDVASQPGRGSTFAVRLRRDTSATR